MDYKLYLNRVAIFKKTASTELETKVSPAGRTYVEDNIVKVTDKKTYRYLKNYLVKKKHFCIYVFTYSENAKYFEKELDKIAKKITDSEELLSDDIMNIHWTDFYIKEDK